MLLKTPSAAINRTARYPAGTYIMSIVSYELLPFIWRKINIYGLAYVPTIRPISCIEADDSSNPELQKEQIELLEKYGDWLSKDFQFFYMDRNIKMAQASKINFPLMRTNETHQKTLGLLGKYVDRFYLNENSKESGFVHDILGLSFKPQTKIEDIMETTVGKKFILSFIYEPNPYEPTSYPPLTIEMITSA